MVLRPELSADVSLARAERHRRQTEFENKVKPDVMPVAAASLADLSIEALAPS